MLLPVAETPSQSAITFAQSHYENFPVASPLLPAHLRLPVAEIYRFARRADDLADEGTRTDEERLGALRALQEDLQLIQAYIQPYDDSLKPLQSVIRQYQLNTEYLLDLVSAFSQDVTKVRYQTFDEVLDYCRRSANPIGRLLLQLYGNDSVENRAWSDHVCTALQLINFYQDIAIDLQKHGGSGRIYLSLQELHRAGLSERDLSAQRVDAVWQAFFKQQVLRAARSLRAGKPLGKQFKGRVGLEVRMIIAAGECMVTKLLRSGGDIYHHRPKLGKRDWLIIFCKALLSL